MVATAVSAIALIENGHFVEYKALFQLMEAMPVSQQRLVELHVLQDASIRRLKQGYILHLAKDIPITIPPKTTTIERSTVTRVPRDPLRLAPVYHPLIDQEEEDTNLTVCSRQPVGGRKPWSNQEEELFLSVAAIPLSSYTAKYKRYCELCDNAKVLPRTYQAFTHKLKSTQHKRWCQEEKDIAEKIHRESVAETVNCKYAKYQEACKRVDIIPRSYKAFAHYISNLKN